MIFTKKDNKQIIKNYKQVLGLDLERLRLERVISRVRKNNVLVVGEEGVGRTSLIRAFILDEAKKGKEIYEVDSSDMLIKLTNENNFEDLKISLHSINNGLIFIDNVTTLLNFDRKNIYRLSALLLGVSENPKVSVVITSTPSEFRTYFEKDTNFSSFYAVINLREPENLIVEEIIKFKKKELVDTYDVDFSDNIIEDVVNFSKRYLYGGKFMPSKALDLLDESLVMASLDHKKDLQVSDIKRVISERTGIPVSNITTSDRERLLNLENILNSSVIGQEKAVSSVTKIIKRSRVGVKDPKRPIGSFLFLGTSGVGKTELAKALAKEVFLDESALIRIDMSEYSEAHNVQRLIGAPPGYVGYEEGGQLTNPVWDRPYSLILLDEIEKAHPRVFDLFLQIIDEGRLTDGQGRTVNFNNTVIIATSNIGVSEIVKPEVLSEVDNPIFNDKYIIPMLIKYFRPEFINRFDEIVFFTPLTKESIEKIIELRLVELSIRLKELGVNVKYKDETKKYILSKSYNPKFGARPVNRVIRETIENPIAESLLKNTINKSEEILI